MNRAIELLKSKFIAGIFTCPKLNMNSLHSIFHKKIKQESMNCCKQLDVYKVFGTFFNEGNIISITFKNEPNYQLKAMDKIQLSNSSKKAAQGIKKQSFHISKQIQQLNAKKIFKLFIDSQKFDEFSKIGSSYFTSYCWKLQYILGELFIKMEVMQNDKEYKQPKIDFKLLRQDISKIIEGVRTKESDEDLQILIYGLTNMLCSQSHDQQAILVLSSDCMKLWKRYTSKKQQNEQSYFKDKDDKSSSFRSKTKTNDDRKQVKPFEDSDQKQLKNGFRHKAWDNQTQIRFCQLYRKLDSSFAVKIELEKIYGKNQGWDCTKRIEDKIYGIVTKAFKKLEFIQSLSPSIQKLIQCKLEIVRSELISEQARRIIFKIIFQIYENMINDKSFYKRKILIDKIDYILSLIKMLKAKQ